MPYRRWISSCQKSWSSFLFVPPFPLTERTFWRQQPWEICRKHVPWGEKLPQASESLFTTSCACYFHQNRALSFLLPCFFVLLAGGCYCKALTPLCSAVRWESSCPLPWRRQERRDGWTKGRHLFIFPPGAAGVFYRLRKSLWEVYRNPAQSPNFPNLWTSAVLHQVQLEDRWSLAGTFVIIYWVRCIPDIEGEDRKSINWIGLPGPEGGLLTLACVAQAQLSSIKLLFFTAVWAIKLNFIKRSQQKREDI